MEPAGKLRKLKAVVYVRLPIEYFAHPTGGGVHPIAGATTVGVSRGYTDHHQGRGQQ